MTRPMSEAARQLAETIAGSDAGVFSPAAKELAEIALSTSASERGMREAIREFVAWADRNDWGTLPKKIEASLRAALSSKGEG